LPRQKFLPVGAAATAEHDEKNDGADDRNQKRAKTAETIGEEGEHLLSIAGAAGGGLVTATR
jgi:hypothetical protein